MNQHCRCFEKAIIVSLIEQSLPSSLFGPPCQSWRVALLLLWTTGDGPDFMRRQCMVHADLTKPLASALGVKYE
jgi:hypothetical protein